MDHIELEPCPCCGGEVVLTTSRDINVFETYIECSDCDSIFFECHTLAKLEMPASLEEEKLCYKLVSMTYNRFCKTNPTNYKGVFFNKYSHNKKHLN